MGTVVGELTGIHWNTLFKSTIGEVAVPSTD